jgi:hypothetical protein
MSDADGVRDSDSIVVGIKELSVAARTWASWQKSAQETVRRAARWSALTGTAVGLPLAGSSLITLREPSWLLLALSVALLLGSLAWYVARVLLQRRHFSPTADQMRKEIVPALLSRAGWDELLRLARRGAGGFTHDSTIVRSEQRNADLFLVATEYDVSKGDWPPVMGYGG